MRKLLKTSDWLLLGLGGFLDFVQDMKDVFGLISNYYSSIHGYIPSRFQKQNLYRLIWRNLKTGDIEKVIEKGKPILKLTSSGHEKIKRKFPLLKFQNNIWDEKWRLVIFDIEERTRNIRDIFRRKLKELGFAQLQKSVWISPHDILGDFKEFIESQRLSDKVILVETESLYTDEPKELAERLWRVSEINEKYEELYENLTQLKDNRRNYFKKFDGKKQFVNYLKEKIINLYLKDPYLPEELLPKDWYGDRVREMTKELKIFK